MLLLLIATGEMIMVMIMMLTMISRLQVRRGRVIMMMPFY